MSEGGSSSAVIIIGASLAGCAAAIELGKCNVSTLLLDKATFPRRKPCGEGLSSRGSAELIRLGVSKREIREIGRELRGYRIYRDSSAIELPDSSGLIGVPREILDDLLLARALSYKYVRFCSGVTARGVHRESDGFRIETSIGDLTSRFVIIADGGNSKSARSLGLSSAEVIRPRYGTSSAWRVTSGTLEPFVSVSLVEGGEMYVTPLLDGRCNISVLGTKELVQRASRSDETRKMLEAGSAMANIEFDQEGASLGAGPVNVGYRASEVHGALLVGDACETLDPCAGFGMTHALISGRIAAECVSRAVSSREPARELAHYEYEREQAVRDIRGFTRLTSYMMSSELGRRTLPLAAKLGIAERISHAAHMPHERPFIGSVIRTVGVL
jgi:flavin-dependent dehydrogenase